MYTYCVTLTKMMKHLRDTSEVSADSKLWTLCGLKVDTDMSGRIYKTSLDKPDICAKCRKIYGELK